MLSRREDFVSHRLALLVLASLLLFGPLAARMSDGERPQPRWQGAAALVDRGAATTSSASLCTSFFVTLVRAVVQHAEVP